MNRTIFTITVGMLALVASMLVLGTGTGGAAGETGNVAASVLQAQNGSQPQQPDVPLVPVTTTFTYQGYLVESGSPATGQFDFEFRLFDAASGGAPIGPIVFRSNETVSNGIFTVPLDFGILNGTAGWLEIKVRRVGGPSFILLTPRQRLTPAPYAMTLKPGAVISGTNGTEPLLKISNSANRRGLEARSNGGVGVYGFTTASGIGVFGETTGNGQGVFGHATGNGQGVYGLASLSGASGVYGYNSGGYGVYAVGNTALYGDGHQYGLFAISDNIGAYILSTGLFGVHSTARTAVFAYGYNTGVRAFGTDYGIYADSNTNGWAGYFAGDVHVSGSCCDAATGSIRIDHPLDPANKYLSHSAVVSPDMMDIYNGNTTTDGKGAAVVTLPDWFEALNKDFRYQLTPIGQFAQAIVAEEVKGNRFTIKTDKPSVKVSWQVTGIRKDAYAEAHRIPVEEAKEGDEKGKYLYPEEHGQPESKGIEYERLQQMREEAEKAKSAEPAEPVQPVQPEKP